MFEIVTDHNPTKKDIDIIEENLSEYNRKHTGFSQPKKHAIYVKKDGEIAGGIVFVCMEPWAYIKLLWVSDDLRGKGYGAKLLDAAETQARSLGSTKMMLDTFSFQAPMFYLKQSYRVISHIDGYPGEGMSRTWFMKAL
ncbi:MAG: GNAT family N-acetyltransferase [Clostridia bacterium]|jgi:GNAT superfamily N-acetyltransferase|nr:GNAT family N-acetyltransferase [Clostridia bacterium]MBT7122886.1 GNAT family N-acetyltransferase [Clostridia bacterium]